MPFLKDATYIHSRIGKAFFLAKNYNWLVKFISHPLEKKYSRQYSVYYWSMCHFMNRTFLTRALWKIPTITFQFIRFRLQNGFESLWYWIMFKYRSNERAFFFMPLELSLWLISGQPYMQLFYLPIQNIICGRLRFIFKV